MKHRRILLRALALSFALGLVGCTAGSTPAPSATTQAPTDSLERTIQSLMDQGSVAVVVQVRWPEGEWSKAYGVRTLDGKQPAQVDDKFSVASISKSMTAVSVLKMVDDGLIGLDDPVNDILPSFKTLLKPPGPITVRQLLNHTSGLRPFQEVTQRSPDDALPGRGLPLSVQEGIEIAATLPWESRRVGLFSYSDSNYFVLGQLLEELRGKPYPEVLNADVIDPLGLDKTSIGERHWDDPDIVHGYITLRGERLDHVQSNLEIDSPAYGVISTVPEVNEFFAGLLGGRLVSDTALADMKKTDSSPYGLGIWRFSEDCKGSPRYGGLGGFWAYRTTAISSEDGRYQATLIQIPPPMPSELEDPESADKLEQWDSQVESALVETLERLCR
jgi:D-alanyl-D-alanine carboxypeptidase